jgi:hypothetical protein
VIWCTEFILAKEKCGEYNCDMVCRVHCGQREMWMNTAVRWVAEEKCGRGQLWPCLQSPLWPKRDVDEYSCDLVERVHCGRRKMWVSAVVTRCAKFIGAEEDVDKYSCGLTN